MIHIAFLRGVNVGGKALVSMKELAQALNGDVMRNVTTYIQSGNVIFDSSKTDTLALAEHIKEVLQHTFHIDTTVAVFSLPAWQAVIDAAPKWWGADAAWKHNMLIMIPPFTMDDVVATIGVLKPGIEAMMPGEGVLYQSVSFKAFGRSTASKIVGNPIYKKMTIRNYNTATKLLAVMHKAAE